MNTGSMLRICHKDIWGTNLTWNTDVPNFSPCLRLTVLTWIPCFFLLLFGSLELYSLNTLKAKNYPWKLLNASRFLLTIFCVFANLFDLGKYIDDDSHFFIYFNSAALKVFTFLLASVIQVTQKNRGISTSPVLWLFLILNLICLTPTIFQLYFHSQSFNTFDYFAQISYICLLIALFVLSSFSDSPKDTRKCFSEANETVPLLQNKQSTRNVRAPCPESRVSFPSQLAFAWLTHFAILGYRKPLVIDDIFDLNEDLKGEVINSVFERNGYCNVNGIILNENEIKLKYRNRSIIRTVIKVYWFEITIATILLLVSDLTGLLAPVLLKYLLLYLSSNGPLWQGIVIAFAMFTSNIVSNFSLNHYFLKTNKLRVKTECCVTNLIYKKSLRISSFAKKSSKTGQEINLIAVDVQRIVKNNHYALYILTKPLVIVIALFLMFEQLGSSAFGGVIVFIFTIPIIYILSKLQKAFQAKQMKLKDERINKLYEAFNGIKLLKLYAWEPCFIKLISKIRTRELQAYKVVTYVITANRVQSGFALFLIVFVTLAIYSFSGGSETLTAEKIFVTLSLIEVIRLPISMLPQAISYIVMAYVSSKRIDEYLNSHELVKYVTRYDSNCAVEIKDGHFQWDEEDVGETNCCNLNLNSKSSNLEILSGINLKVAKGSLHAIVGQVGSGKSSLLAALLGEISKVGGAVNIQKGLKIAYVSQQSWIQNMTLRDNILFGKEFNQQKYEKVINACALREDLEILSEGDLTEIGEKGINLSGGQKQRVSLARACYSDADLYLLDDPLSAVDVQVAKHIFNHVLGSKKGLLKYTTRILVTNQIDFLSNVDIITVVKNGKIREQGTYSYLVRNNNDLSNFVNQGNSSHAKNAELSSVSNTVDDRNTKRSCMKTTKLVDTETPEFGNVRYGVYKSYFKVITACWCVLILIGICGCHVTAVAGNLWLASWRNDNSTCDSCNNDLRNYRFFIYAIIGFMQMICLCFEYLVLFKAGLRSSANLHSNLLNRIFRAPMSFFEFTPLGRILNRFSTDMDSVDTYLPQYFNSLLHQCATLFFSLAIITFQCPYFLLLFMPMLVVYYFIQKIYISTSRQLQRLQSISRSPIYSHFSQTLQGLSTIRALNANQRFELDFSEHVDKHSMCVFAFLLSTRWLSVIITIFGSLVILFVALFATTQRDSLTQGVVGLSVIYAFTVTESLTRIVRYASLVETCIVSVERIDEYCNVDQEAEWVNESKKAPDFWTNNGTITFKHYSTRYRPGLDLVLNNISLQIKSGEKVGIVGRTGAGKSTIALSLFRLIEAVKGKILIDDLNIANIGLHDLRSKLTIIPQDPVLFSGTLRFNLDPFDAYTDHQIWDALKHSHLRHFVSGLEKGLSHEISERGQNFSVGQRQLICLARALLKKSKILVLDEATSAVDLETDSLIQTTIKNEFLDCTTLTIAHRIQTILDCDRVMVIDSGTIVEYDSPSILSSNPNSIFFNLAKHSLIVS